MEQKNTLRAVAQLLQLLREEWPLVGTWQSHQLALTGEGKFVVRVSFALPNNTTMSYSTDLPLTEEDLEKPIEEVFQQLRSRVRSSAKPPALHKAVTEGILAVVDEHSRKPESN
jgi:hypothetical protein